MIVNMSEKATEQEINHIIERIREAGYQPLMIPTAPDTKTDRST